MKITELLKALEIVKPALANKEMIEQSTSFAFMQGRIVTYNDEISISHPIEGLEIEGAIQAEELYQLLKKIKKEEIEIQLKENEIILQVGRMKARLTLQQKIKLPLEEIEEQGKWKPLPENFITALQFALPSCSRDMSRPVLTCVHVSKGGFVEGSDGYCVSRHQLDKEGSIDTFLLPATSVTELIKLEPAEFTKGKGWVHFRKGKGWVHFRTKEGTVFSGRIFTDDFPNTGGLLKVEGKEITFPKTVNDILDRAAVFAKRDHFLDESIDIHLEENQIKVSCKSETTSAWFEETANMRYKEGPVSFSITPYLLRSILLQTQNCILGENCLKFQSDKWEYIAVLSNT